MQGFTVNLYSHEEWAKKHCIGIGTLQTQNYALCAEHVQVLFTWNMIMNDFNLKGQVYLHKAPFANLKIHVFTINLNTLNYNAWMFMIKRNIFGILMHLFQGKSGACAALNDLFQFVVLWSLNFRTEHLSIKAVDKGIACLLPAYIETSYLAEAKRWKTDSW